MARSSQQLAALAGTLLWAWCLCVAAEEQIIRVTQIGYANDRHAVAAVELAFSRIDHNYRIKEVPGQISQARNIDYVRSGDLDMMWAATNQEMEDMLLPVRIPLYKGLLGHRILIIHRDHHQRFDGIQTLEDLQRLTFGQGTTWADTAILRHNGLTVVTANKFDSLFYMADGNRFDAFPRGVQEPWAEIESRPHLELAVERRLMLVYRMPFYLFVSHDNPQLAADIERGLNLAIADGSFDELFFAAPTVQDVLQKSNLQGRLIFELDNPTLPPETPVDRPELWLDISTL
jgi:hypothetical protein